MAGGPEDPGVPRAPHEDLSAEEFRRRYPQLCGGGGPPAKKPPAAPPAPGGEPRKASKYRNRFTVVDGVTFRSKREADRYVVLRLIEKAGGLRDLLLQPRYPLVVNGVKVGEYVGDFRYVERGPAGERLVLEDVKGAKTPLYKLKKKLVQALYGLDVRET